MLLVQGKSNDDRDRAEQYSAFAQRRFQSEVVVPPVLLSDYERRLHVRHTLREDHQFRIKNWPEGAQRKFDKLADDVYDFFRGTALLFYRDYAGMDAHLPMVFTIGDMHPENFGVMPNEDNVPFFGVNDFDEAIFAPFSYDVRRCAVGFYIAAKENGIKKKQRKHIVRAWAEGYIDGLVQFMEDNRAKTHQFRIDNSPKMIRDLLENALKSRESFLEDKIDLHRQQFLTTDEILPHSRHISEFQKVINTYVKTNNIRTPDMDKDFFRVQDVAVKIDSGTASLGLDRYWILIRGRGDDVGETIILEMKQSRRSALYGLVPPTDFDNDGSIDQVVQAHQVHLAGGDWFYGRADYQGTSFVVRERSPFKDEIDVDDLDADDMETYARICAKALAQTHARSDDSTGALDGNAERAILSAIEPTLFVDDTVRFAHVASKRIYNDWKLFKQDHALGAFNFVRQVT